MSEGTSSRKRVLVVEDDASLRDILCELLELEGYEVLVASNGADGFRLLEQHRVWLVLLDVMMPKMDGFKFMEALAQRPEEDRPPVLLVTALTPGKDLVPTGTCAVLQKPFNVNQLFELVEQHVSAPSA